ncbi:MAG: EF-hand domain-containing protein [Alphaproteobacteria bacterium]
MKTTLLALSLALATAMPAQAQGLDRLRAADTDGDGAVSRAELLLARAAWFGWLDRDGDGFVDVDDLPPGLAGSPRGVALHAVMAQIDLDGDGRISQEELAKGPTPVFDRIDTDGNGIVTEVELAAAVAAFHAGR